MDIGAAIKAPMEDKEWIKKCIIIALICIIPIAGILNLLGWLAATYKNVRAGTKDLPEANLSYIGAGWWLFVALLPLVGVSIGFQILIQILVQATGSGIVALIGALLNLVVSLAVAIAYPAAMLLHLEKGYRWAGAKFGEIIPLMTGNVGPYVMFLVLAFVAGIIGGAGMIACGVGMLLTMPWCYAIMANGLAQLAKETKLAA